MNLEDFGFFVKMTNCVETHSYNNLEKQNENFDLQDILIDALSKSNLLASDIIVQQGATQSRNILLRLDGIVMSKIESDYEADILHYVYRSVYRVELGMGLGGISSDTPNAEIISSLIDAGIQRTLGHGRHNLPVAIEITQYGRMSDVSESWTLPPERQNRQHRYLLDHFSRSVSKQYITTKRGSEYTLFDYTEGVVGMIKFRVLENISSMAPLTKDDMTLARGFIKLEDDYTGWIPSEALRKEKPLIMADDFTLYRIGNTDRSIKATTLLGKTRDQRTYFSSKTELQTGGKRYTIPSGEYFFTVGGTCLVETNLFLYEEWLADLSTKITIKKTNSKIDFLTSSTHDEVVKSINVKGKTIESSKNQSGGSTFTRLVKSDRLK